MNKYILISFFLISLGTFAQKKDELGLRAIGTPHNPKVQVAWNRYYAYDEVVEICRKIQKAYPNLVTLESIGKSFKGKDMWVMTITDSKGGKAENKPAFYIDGNIHSNEIQGTEIALYTAWYLTENHQSVKFIQELLQEKTFYIIPSINPDARDEFLKNLNNANTPRSGVVPVDDDGDGTLDEDDFDDLNGDGEVTLMRRKTKTGRYIPHPEDPRQLILAKPGEEGMYELLGYEGLDNDNDGFVNEDRKGYYDPNRDWGWNWQPDYIQSGANKYPFSLPESRSVMEFVMKHPNIAGSQHYHNYSGMFLRGPGAEEDQFTYSPSDIAVYDVLGKTGERMIPGYKYLVSYKDLYTTYGGASEWMHAGRGVTAFVNELMTSYLLFDKNPDAGIGRFENNEFYEFDKLLLFGDAFIEWKPFKHPNYGDIEIGGFKKNYVRNHPGFLLEQDAHRNMAFTLFHAYSTPKLEVVEVKSKSLGNGFTQITATVANTRIIPTHLSHDIKNKINPPNYVTLKGESVVAGLLMENADFNIGKEQKGNLPATVEVTNIAGMGNVKVRWIVKGSPKNYNIELKSAKGGFNTHTGTIQPE
ncbi:MAG: M14 family metallopeptidase [Raineya sp.]|jgi:hypothetical protein|nr:M14 family metallopeptidase [Raineya sp.]